MNARAGPGAERGLVRLAMDAQPVVTGVDNLAAITECENSGGMKRHRIDKRKRRTHQYGRKKKQYKGRKKRLRSQNEELKKAVESAQQEQNKLETKANEFLRETVRLRRLVVVV